MFHYPTTFHSSLLTLRLTIYVACIIPLSISKEANRSQYILLWSLIHVNQEILAVYTWYMFLRWALSLGRHSAKTCKRLMLKPTDLMRDPVSLQLGCWVHGQPSYNATHLPFKLPSSLYHAVTTQQYITFRSIFNLSWMLNKRTVSMNVHRVYNTFKYTLRIYII